VEAVRNMKPRSLDRARPAPPTLREATRDFQRRFIRDVLAEELGNITRTARRLDLSRSHLYARLHELAIEPVRP